jgi:hypothetical protein
MDLQWIVSTIQEYKLPLTEDDVLNMVDDYRESQGIPHPDTDPCGLLLDYIIQNSTLPDEIKDELQVYSNYLDSSIQMNEKTARAIEEYCKDNIGLNKYDEYILDRANDF